MIWRHQAWLRLTHFSWLNMRTCCHTAASHTHTLLILSVVYMNVGLIEIVRTFNEMASKTGRMKYDLNMSLVQTYLGAVSLPEHRREFPGRKFDPMQQLQGDLSRPFLQPVE